jgi:hypothetical protein
MAFEMLWTPLRTTSNDWTARSDGNDLQGMILTETGRNESIDVLVVEASALFDHRLCQSRQRGKLDVLRQSALADGLPILRVEEGDGPRARVGDRVGEQRGLDLRFRDAAAAHIPEHPNRPTRQLMCRAQIGCAVIVPWRA